MGDSDKVREYQTVRDETCLHFHNWIFNHHQGLVNNFRQLLLTWKKSCNFNIENLIRLFEITQEHTHTQ